MRHAWGSPTLSDELPSQKKLSNFALATDPLNLMSERASFALYMRGDVAGAGEFATCMYEIVRNAGPMDIVGREE